MGDSHGFNTLWDYMKVNAIENLTPIRPIRIFISKSKGKWDNNHNNVVNVNNIIGNGK
jgi:hypothetical protein